MADTETRFLHVRVPGTEDPVIRLDADPDADSVGNIIAGGHNVNGSLLLFTSGATDTVDAGTSAISIRASNLEVRFRRPEVGFPVSMELIGGLGKIFAGGAPNTSAEIVLRGAAEEGGDLPPARIRLVARDPVTGDASVTVGAQEGPGTIRVVDENGQLAVVINSSGTGPEILLGNGIRLQVSTLFGDTAGISIGGSGFNGSLNVRSSPNDDDTTFTVSIINGRLTFSRDNQVTMRLDGDAGNIRCGGSNSADGDLLLFPQNSDIDVTSEATVHLDGAGGSIRAGSNGRPGRLVVRNDDAEDTVVMDGDSGDIILRNADCAEEFDIDPTETVDPGTVLILGPDGLRPCNEAYDKKVVGVMSGAGQFRPGIVLDRKRNGDNRAPVALVGKAYCNDTTWENAGQRDWFGEPPVRRNGCAVLLPTGQVLLCGGVTGVTIGGDFQERDSTAVLNGELYDPGIGWATNTYDPAREKWTTAEAARVVRNYHSVALLTRDGRVWTAGSNKNGGQTDPDDLDATVEFRIESYKPIYDGDPDRPTIEEAPESITWGRQFSVRSSEADSIERIAVMRCGSVTHAFDGDQRYVGLPFDFIGGSTLRVEAPPDGNVAPPGCYMLWLIDHRDRPCHEAAMIIIGD